MATSRRFQQLVSELGRLDKHFVPKQRQPIASYSQRRTDHARAYRLLAHAEIESYIEDVLWNVVSRKHALWKSTRKPSYVMTCLVAAAKIDWYDNESVALEAEKIHLPKIRKDDDSINIMIERAVKQYSDIIQANNGIKARDIKRMIMPIGIALSDLDPTWLIYMESFGGKRGSAAHSSRLGMTVALDPWSEHDEVRSLLGGLEVIDTLARAALKTR